MLAREKRPNKLITTKQHQQKTSNKQQNTSKSGTGSCCLAFIVTSMSSDTWPIVTNLPLELGVEILIVIVNKTVQFLKQRKCILFTYYIGCMIYMND